MRGNLIESVMGAVVLVVAALFLFFAFNTSQLRAVPGYELVADFERVDGVREGGDVRISGIKIGSIVGETLKPYLLVKTDKVPPADTIASIGAPSAKHSAAAPTAL